MAISDALTNSPPNLEFQNGMHLAKRAYTWPTLVQPFIGQLSASIRRPSAWGAGSQIGFWALLPVQFLVSGLSDK